MIEASKNFKNQKSLPAAGSDLRFNE